MYIVNPLLIFSMLVAPLFSAQTLPQGSLAAAASMAEVSAPTPTTVAEGFYNLYAPSVITHQGSRRMWLGGAAARSEASSSAIYMSQVVNGYWSEPVKTLELAGNRIGDPSVIVDPTDGVTLLMYYTMISAVDAASSTTAVLRNRVGFAESRNYGETWQHKGVIVEQNNGIDGRGGWAPSAVAVGDEIWLYYSTNVPTPISVYRARVNAETKKVIVTEPVYLKTATTTVSFSEFGVAVSVSPAGLSMLSQKNFSGINRYVSDDGLLWRTATDEKNPIIKAGPGLLVAMPTKEVLYAPDDTPWQDGRIYFSGGTLASTTFTSIQALDQSYSQVTYVREGEEVYSPVSGEGGSESGGQRGGSGGMGIALLGIAGALGLTYLAISLLSDAASPGFSFGGRVIAMVPCLSPLGPSVWVALKPSGLLLPPFTYIWTPATLTSLVPPIPSLPPRNIGQQLLGRFDIPYACLVGIFPLYGLRMQIMGASPAA